MVKPVFAVVKPVFRIIEQIPCHTRCDYDNLRCHTNYDKVGAIYIYICIYIYILTATMTFLCNNMAWQDAHMGNHRTPREISPFRVRKLPPSFPSWERPEQEVPGYAPVQHRRGCRIREHKVYDMVTDHGYPQAPTHVWSLAEYGSSASLF